MSKHNVFDESSVEAIHELIKSCGGDPGTFDGELVTQMVQTSVRMLTEGHDTGQMKLINRSLKEMRYAYRVFNQYPGNRRVSIFGSARTPEGHPDYLAAMQFSAKMVEHGWSCITGGANGIMKAGMEGVPPEASYGLTIRIPFEDTVNTLIEDNPKQISFRYFFVRKLMFMSHSDAMAAFPGGVGTQDEVFEMVTLMQTGKASIIPIVLVEGEGGEYWHYWELYVKKNLIRNGWVSPEDKHFWYRATCPEDAAHHISKFYRRYHSYRYVGDLMVIRINKPLDDVEIRELNEEFSSIVSSGEIYQREALEEEDDHMELPRIVFHHTRRNFAILRKMIDVINQF